VRYVDKRGELNPMVKQFTLEYWPDEAWFVGRLKEVPGVFSQGETVKELEENIREAYRLMLEEDPAATPHPDAQTKDIAVVI
jgi:predicted RNase H-like HicB family nuclease